VYMLWKNWHDHKKEVEENTKTVKDFEKTIWDLLSPQQLVEAGGQQWAATTIAVRDAYLATGRSADDAYRDVKAMWDAAQSGAVATKGAIDLVNQAFVEQRQDAENLEAAVRKYGFSIEELGPAMQKQNLNAQAATLMNDFRLLAGAEIDVQTIIEHMGGALNDFVGLSRRTGVEVPYAMKPLIEKAIEMVALFDDNGDKITDMGATGITFAETMTQGFDRLVKKFDELLGRIGMVPNKLAAIPSSIPDPFANWSSPGIPDLGIDTSYASTGGDVPPILSSVFV
jgi:hypothetical protein